MTQYGFSLPTNLEIENDGEESYIQWTGEKSGNQLGVSPQVLDEVIDSLVDATIAFKLDDGGSLSAYTNMETVACAELGNRLRFLCNVEGGQNTKNDVLQALLQEVEQAEAQLPSSFEHDQKVLLENSDESNTEDPFRTVKKAIINYRLNKKAPYAVAKTLIETAAAGK
jgi:hypothetical protein